MKVEVRTQREVTFTFTPAEGQAVADVLGIGGMLRHEPLHRFRQRNSFIYDVIRAFSGEADEGGC